MDKSLTTGIDPIDPLLGWLDINRVLGVPGEVGDLAVIPVAELTTGFGYGRRVLGRNRAGDNGSGARAMGYLRVAEDSVEFEPMPDRPGMSIAGICLLGWVLFWVAHIVRDLARARR